MAKTPPLEGEIEKVKAAVSAMRLAEADLLELLKGFSVTGNVAVKEEGDDSAERQALDAVLARYDEAEKNFANLTLSLSGEIEKAFESFHAASERTRYEKLMTFFSRSKAMKLRAERVKKLAIAQELKRLLFLCDDVAALLSEEKRAASDLHEKCETPLVDLMEKRREAATTIEAGRQRLKEINATLATVQWKLGSVTDDKRRVVLEAEREALSLTLEEQERDYRLTRARHERLEEHILLQEALSQQATQRLSAHATLYNILVLDMERAIQLYGAVTMTLDGLMQDISQVDNVPRPHLLDLLRIHAHNTVTLDDIDKRRMPVKDAFARRYRVARARVVAIESTGQT